MRRKLVAMFGIAAMICTLTLTAGIVLAANPSADLDQCANGQSPSPSTNGCNGTAGTSWVNGNLGPSKSVYAEGESIPYRLRFGNLPLASHVVDIEWDTTKAGKHALDYITDFNESVADANPCLGVSGCDPNIFSTFDIPADPQVTDEGVTPIAGVFHIYGGTITAVSDYSYSNGDGFAGDKSAGLSITFTATRANPVLAWGGHIATRLDWGADGSAVAISGSPYHTRLLDLNGSGGNQDRSLSAAAVIFPGTINIIKDVLGGSDAQDFSFTTTGGLTPATFSLDDDATNTLGNTQSYTGITNFTTYTVTEGALAGWSLNELSCVGSFGNGGSSGTNLETRTVTINLAEGETWTCTFGNFLLNPALSILKQASPTTYDTVGQTITYTITATNTGNVVLNNVTVTDPGVDGLTCVPANGSSLGLGASMVCSATHTITQDDIDNGSFMNTACVDDGAGGAAQVCDDETVTSDQDPELTIVKLDDGEKYDVGDTISYTIKVTNTGNVTLDGVVVTDAQAQNLVCSPTPPVDDFAPGDEINCTASHVATAEDLAAGSYFNEACADDGEGDGTAGAAAVCDDVTTPAKAIPGIATTEVYVPQDSVTLTGIAGASPQGDLYIELRINEQCGADDSPAWTYTWLNIGNGTVHTKDVVGSPTAQPAAIGADATVRWCTSYSGDADNAARPLSSRGEISSIDFDPVGVLGFGSSVVTLLAWALWSRRRKETAAA